MANEDGPRDLDDNFPYGLNIPISEVQVAIIPQPPEPPADRSSISTNDSSLWVSSCILLFLLTFISIGLYVFNHTEKLVPPIVVKLPPILISIPINPIIQNKSTSVMKTIPADDQYALIQAFQGWNISCLNFDIHNKVIRPNWENPICKAPK